MQAVARWLWNGDSAAATMLRASLAPASMAMDLATRARGVAYARGILAVRRLPAPSIVIGNLTVGGTGKTPVASWVAGWLAGQGLRPGVLLRGGAFGDEAAVHRALQPSAIVVENADRVAGARAALCAGADILVLDDGYQRIDVARDVNILLVSADQDRVPRLLPQGPWREPLHAAARADLIIVTRKHAPPAVARRVARRMSEFGAPVAIAALRISDFQRVGSGQPIGSRAIENRSVLASAGIASYDSFAAQLASLGARVTRLPWPDHHQYNSRDVRQILDASQGLEETVITGKDAVKLCTRWPATERAPLVARLELSWEQGETTVTAVLARFLSQPHPHPHTHPYKQKPPTYE